jgi:cyanophycinase
MKPKGKLLIIGGHEEKGDPEERLTVSKRAKSYQHFEILNRLIDLMPAPDSVIEIITTASYVPKEMKRWYKSAFKKEKFKNIQFLHSVKGKQNQEEGVERIKKAGAVFFTGGDQIKLVNEFRGTKIIKAIKERYINDKNFIIAGTSAGAMSLAHTIIKKGLIGEVLLKDDLVLSRGFNLIQNVIVDTHLIQRGRFARLAQAVIQYPKCLGVGLSENTALLISDGNEAECLGSGMAILIDGSKMKVNNGGIRNKDTALVAQNLLINIMADGCKYFLKEKKFVLMM